MPRDDDRPPTLPPVAAVFAGCLAVVVLGVGLGCVAFVAWRVFQGLCYHTGGI